jgi:hypothetical protein
MDTDSRLQRIEADLAELNTRLAAVPSAAE